MKNWVDYILVPYFQTKKAVLGLQPDHLCILQLDVWPVHTSEEFHVWMWENHREIILIYVPGGCTGVWQPCDVGLQQPLKQAVVSQQNEARIQEVTSKLESGKEFATLQLDESIKHLQD